MGDIAIRVEALGKQYRLGQARAPSRMRAAHALLMPAAPLRQTPAAALRHRVGRDPAPDPVIVDAAARRPSKPIGDNQQSYGQRQ